MSGKKPLFKLSSVFDRSVIAIVVLGIAGFWIHVNFDHLSFPNASISLKVSRAEANKKARELARSRGYFPSKPISSTVFGYYGHTKSFLEYELGQEKANNLMKNEIPVWYWSSRLCEEFSQEEFGSTIALDGRLLSFWKTIPNDKKMKSLNREEALVLAKKFKRENFAFENRYSKLIIDNVISRPHRTDYTFTWEDEKTIYKEGKNRLSVSIAGDEIIGCSKYFYVPESWSKKFATKRSSNYLLYNIFNVFYLMFGQIAILIAIWGVITKNLRWKFSLSCGFLLAIVEAINYFNGFPGIVFAYSTTSSFQNYLTDSILSSFRGIFYNTLYHASLVAGAEIAYRKLFPQKISMEKLFTKRGLCDNSTLQEIIVGHASAGIFLGWVVAFYFFGKNFQFWCPLGLENYKLIGDVVPFFSAFALALRASYIEELTSRVIGIWVGMKLFKNFWIANLFQAVVWAFCHSTYAQEPAYVRGLELTFAGLFDGWILRRFGIVACFTSHYLINAFLHVAPLLNAESLSIKLTAVPALIPAICLVAISFLLIKFEKKDKSPQLDDQAIPFGKADDVSEKLVEKTFQYKPLSPKVRIGLSTFVLIFAIGLFVFPTRYGVNTHQILKTNRSQAIERAKQVMKEHNVNPDGWMIRTYCSLAVAPLQYIFEKAGSDKATEVLKETRRGYSWRVGFFKPLTIEKYWVYLDGKGNESSFQIEKKETARGANISKEEARKLARNYLNKTHPEYKDAKFSEISLVKRPNRTDYYVEYSFPKLNIDQAEYKISIDLLGRQVDGIHYWWDIPDSWTFEKNKWKTKNVIFSNLRNTQDLIGYGLFILWCFLFVRAVKVGFNKTAFVIALCWVALLLGEELLEYNEFFQHLSSTKPVATYVTEELIRIVQKLVGSGVWTFVFVVICLTSLDKLFPNSSHKQFIKNLFSKEKQPHPKPSFDRSAFFIDAVIISYFSAVVFWFIHLVNALVSWHFSPSVQTWDYQYLTNLANTSFVVPFVLIESLQNLLKNGGTFLVVVAIIARFIPDYRKLFLLGMVVFAINWSGCRYWQDFLINYVHSLISYSICYWIVVKYARNNYLAYFFYYVVGVIFGYIEAMVYNQASLFKNELIFLSFLVVLPWIIALALFLNERKATQVNENPESIIT